MARHTRSVSPTRRISSLMVAFLLVASLLPLIAIISEPVQASPAEDNFNVTWELVQGGIIHKVYEIEVQNLADETREGSISSFFENLSFDISELRNVNFYEWENCRLVKIPIYENVFHENVPIYDNENWELIVGYEDRWWSEVVGYEDKFRNDWNPHKVVGEVEDTIIKKYEYGFITLPKSTSDPTYDDFGQIETANGTKWFRIEFDVPITETPKGWGSSGKVALAIDNAEYHPVWSDGWACKKKITIDCAEVEDTLDNFPVLVSWASDPDLAAHAQDDGDDIAFVNLAETWQFDHEIEFLDGDNGQLVAHVRIPNIYDSENVSFWMLYGNPDAANQENPTGVWDNNFVAVYHMTDNTTSSILDSTSYNNDGTKAAANAPIENDGKIYKAQDFDGSGDYVTLATSGFDPSKGTVSIWLNWAGAAYQVVYVSASHLQNNNRLSFMIQADGTYIFQIHDAAGAMQVQIQPDEITSGWELMSFSWETNSVHLYRNGVEIGSDTSCVMPTSLVTPQLGRYGGSAAYDFVGKLDEFRMSVSIRSAEWIKTTFNNENDPSTFYSVGIEQSTFPEKPELDKPIENQPYFEWSTEAVDNYRLLVDNDSDFSSPCENRVLIENYYQIPAENSLENGVYYWKVIAQNPMGENSSDVWSFVVGIEEEEEEYYRMKITIYHTKVDADLDNFPVLVYLDSSYTDFWSHCDSEANITFTLSDGTTKLRREIDLFDHTNDNLYVHVKVPLLSNSEDTIIYVCYDPTSEEGTNDTDTWDDNFVMVQHMMDNTTSSIEDSTSYNNDGTKEGINEPQVTTSGQIDDAQNFDDDYINCGTHESLNLGNVNDQYTMETWIKCSGSTEKEVLYKTFSPQPMRVKVNEDAWVILYDGENVSSAQSSTAVNDDALHYIAGVVDRLNGELYIYVDGDLDGSGDDICSGDLRNSNPLLIGRKDAAAYYPFYGTMDEIRISNVARSADWISTTFNNQSSPSTFYSVGDEEWMGEEEVGVDENLYVAMAIAVLAAGIGVIIWARGIAQKGEKTKRESKPFKEII